MGHDGWFVPKNDRIGFLRSWNWLERSFVKRNVQRFDSSFITSSFRENERLEMASSKQDTIALLFEDNFSALSVRFKRDGLS